MKVVCDVHQLARLAREEFFCSLSLRFSCAKKPEAGRLDVEVVAISTYLLTSLVVPYGVFVKKSTLISTPHWN
jgi:hypothetical protein